MKKRKAILTLAALCLSVVMLSVLLVSATDIHNNAPSADGEKLAGEPVAAAPAVPEKKDPQKHEPYTANLPSVEEMREILLAKIENWDNADEARERLNAFMDRHTCIEGAACIHAPGMDWLKNGSTETSSLQWVNKIAKDHSEYIKAEEQRRSCTHENCITYYDSDTKESGAICLDCGQKQKSWVAYAKHDITTSAELQSTCSHTYTDWVWYSTTQHVRICTKCSIYSYGTHQVVPADCTTFEHCTVCNGRDSSWDMAYGHQLAYEFDMDRFINQNVYYHSYRCTQTDNDLNPICDYVVSTEPCNFTATYWDAAKNGEHEVYHVCPECIITKFDSPVVCNKVNGLPCSYCNRPNEW